VTHPPEMRAGLTLAERIAKREQLLEQALERARAESSRMFRSALCLFAQKPADHGKCMGETTAGTGCLCECHDQPGMPCAEG
jgi:hypothetical protein